MLLRALTTGATALVLAFALVLSAPGVAAAGTRVVFDESFAFSSLLDLGSVVLPATGGPGPRTNRACLTAQGNGSIGMPTCSRRVAPWSAGKLQLTDRFYNQEGGFFLAETLPGDHGVATRFTSYQHGTAAVPGDGLAFVVAAVDPADPRPPAAMASKGSALGYSSIKGWHGLSHAYLGVGFDVYGGFSRTGNQGSGCPPSAFVSPDAPRPGQVVVRGPGNKSRGYCTINSTATADDAPRVPLHAASREGSAVPAEVALNPTDAAIATEAGTRVPARSYVLTFTPVGGTPRTLTGPLPKVDPELYPASWLDADGYPKRLALGVTATTGAVPDFHEISDVRVTTSSEADPPARLSVGATAYLGPDPGIGDPASYLLRVKAESGSWRTTRVLTTVTLPTGVVPVGGSGEGWDCAARVHQQLRCRQLEPYADNRPSLPELVVQGVLNRPGVTRAALSAGSRVEVSSPDARAVTAGVTAMTDVPPGPADLTLNPSRGPVQSATDVHGTGLDGVSLVRVGTDAELSAGTAAVLVPCFSGNDTRPCFWETGTDPDLRVDPMPDHPLGPVRVQAMGLGTAPSTRFTYTNTPGAPRVDASQQGTWASVDWTVRGDGGSRVTGWTVTPYRDGKKEDPISAPGDVHSIGVPNLQVGAEYVFEVAGRNAHGVGPAGSSRSLVVSGLPGRPTNLVATAGAEEAHLDWTSPDNGGQDIKRWVVTPYRDGVKQEAQLTEEDPFPATRVVDLSPGHSYTFTVAAETVVGVGPASARSAPVVIKPRPTAGVAGG